MKYSPPAFLFLFIFSINFSACKKPHSITKAEVIQQRLDNRLQRWLKGVNDNHRKKIMDAATHIVDSTLLANARLNRDTSAIPAIPERPERPAFEAPKDSTPIEPILEIKTDTAANR